MGLRRVAQPAVLPRSLGLQRNRHGRVPCPGEGSKSLARQRRGNRGPSGTPTAAKNDPRGGRDGATRSQRARPDRIRQGGAETRQGRQIILHAPGAAVITGDSAHADPWRPPVPILTILGVGLASPAAAAWIADVENGRRLRGQPELRVDGPGHRRRGGALDVGLGRGGGVPHRPSQHLLTGDLVGDLHERYSGLDHIALGVTAAFRASSDWARTRPWVRASRPRGGRLQYRVGRARRLVLPAWRPASASDSARGGAARGLCLRWPHRRPRTAGHASPARRRVRPAGAHVLGPPRTSRPRRPSSCSAATRVVSATWRPRPSGTRRSSAASSAVEADPAFGPNAFAYKIDATTHILSARSQPRAGRALVAQRGVYAPDPGSATAGSTTTTTS